MIILGSAGAFASRQDQAPVDRATIRSRKKMIRFEDVTKVYDTTSRPALDSVTTEIIRGEFVFLVGPSIRKSTFIRLVQREEKASSGTVYVSGRDVARLSS